MAKSKQEDDHLPMEGHRGRRELKRLYAMSLREIFKGISECAPKGIRPLRSVKSDYRRAKPFSNALRAREVRNLHDQYKAGHKGAILMGLRVCIRNDLPVPRWCAEAFLTAIEDVERYRAKSWDEVFGRPHKKGAQLAALRKRQDYQGKVWAHINNLKEKNPDLAIDRALFEKVGKEFGIGGKTLTEDYYYSVQKLFGKSSKKK